MENKKFGIGGAPVKLARNLAVKINSSSAGNIDFWDIMLNGRYLNINHPRFAGIFKLSLTNFFFQKFGNQAEEKLNEFLNEELKNQ